MPVKDTLLFLKTETAVTLEELCAGRPGPELHSGRPAHPLLLLNLLPLPHTPRLRAGRGWAMLASRCLPSQLGTPVALGRKGVSRSLPHALRSAGAVLILASWLPSWFPRAWSLDAKGFRSSCQMIPGRGSAHSPTWLKNQSPKQTPWCQDPVGPFCQTQKLDLQPEGLEFCPGS